MHGEARSGRGPLRVVASGNPDEIGKPLALRPAETISAHKLASSLSISRNAVSLSGIIGRKGKIVYRTTGRRWQISVPASKAKRLGCLASDGHGSWHFSSACQLLMKLKWSGNGWVSSRSNQHRLRRRPTTSQKRP